MKDRAEHTVKQVVQGGRVPGRSQQVASGVRGQTTQQAGRREGPERHEPPRCDLTPGSS